MPFPVAIARAHKASCRPREKCDVANLEEKKSWPRFLCLDSIRDAASGPHGHWLRSRGQRQAPGVSEACSCLFGHSQGFRAPDLLCSVRNLSPLTIWRAVRGFHVKTKVAESTPRVGSGSFNQQGADINLSTTNCTYILLRKYSLSTPLVLRNKCH